VNAHMPNGVKSEISLDVGLDYYITKILDIIRITKIYDRFNTTGESAINDPIEIFPCFHLRNRAEVCRIRISGLKSGRRRIQRILNKPDWIRPAFYSSFRFMNFKFLFFIWRQHNH